MSYQIYITDKASNDLDLIYEYIAVNLQSPQNAKSQLNRLMEGIGKLNELPERYSLYKTQNTRLENMRMMPIDSFIVFYIPDINTHTVTVVRVVSHRMDRKGIF